LSGRVGPGRPPAASQFPKGKSGNPKGRPKSGPAPSKSDFDILIDRTLTLAQNGKTSQVAVDEALQHRIYQDAIAGNRAARREVLRMIEKREKWLAARPLKYRPAKQLFEPEDPINANEALILLGIAEPDTRYYPDDEYERLLLRPWAVQAALSRPGRRRLSVSDNDVSEIKRCTRDAHTLRWPGGIE